ncbi:hypothetical protein MBLNU459_g2659t1 [Dothideomycetes sp. NU459]
MVMLQNASPTEVSEILQRIRGTNDLSETVQLIQASSLLLQQDPIQSSSQSQHSPRSASQQQRHRQQQQQNTASHDHDQTHRQQPHPRNPMDLQNLIINEDVDTMATDASSQPSKRQYMAEQYEQQQSYVEDSFYSYSSTSSKSRD